MSHLSWRKKKPIERPKENRISVCDNFKKFWYLNRSLFLMAIKRMENIETETKEIFSIVDVKFLFL